MSSFAVCLVLCLASIQITSTFGCAEGYTGHNGSCYKFSTEQLPWIEAVNTCKLIGGQLVEIETIEEATFLGNYVKGQHGQVFWLGMTDELLEGRWVWVTSQSPVGIFYWAPNEPNNYQGTENCAIINSDGYWADLACNSNLSNYICEAIPM